MSDGRSMASAPVCECATVSELSAHSKCTSVCLYDRCNVFHTYVHMHIHLLTSAVSDTCQKPHRASPQLETERFPCCSKKHCWRRGRGPFINDNFGFLSLVIFQLEPEQRGEEEVGEQKKQKRYRTREQFPSPLSLKRHTRCKVSAVSSLYGVQLNLADAKDKWPPFRNKPARRIRIYRIFSSTRLSISRYTIR